MRLLNVHNLTLHDFHSDVPQYVVASHRWLDGEEATFKDVRKHRNIESAGFQKVRGFARFVQEKVTHVDWLWIDTCCINQKSDREVTEAVNSMFRWYHNAEVCLVYLADVETASDGTKFRQSCWFRRGWTLQELLAPQLVVFVNRDWEIIGHKGGDGWTTSGFEVSTGTSLDAAIATATNIPEAVIRNYNRSKSFSVEEKLAWISGRETTREEDMSYSLFGILDVTLPVIYGEGAERARKRLLEEAYKSVPLTRSSTFVTDSHIPLGDDLPRSDPNHFSSQRSGMAGPEGMLNWISDKLTSPRSSIALVGLGAVGLLTISYASKTLLSRSTTNIRVRSINWLSNMTNGIRHALLTPEYFRYTRLWQYNWKGAYAQFLPPSSSMVDIHQWAGIIPSLKGSE